jgi:hypothetical protein
LSASRLLGMSSTQAGRFCCGAFEAIGLCPAVFIVLLAYTRQLEGLQVSDGKGCSVRTLAIGLATEVMATDIMHRRPLLSLMWIVSVVLPHSDGLQVRSRLAAVLGGILITLG